MEHYIGAYEAKTHLPALLARVAGGEEIVITKHGVPMARLLPADATPRKEDRKRIIARMLKRSRSLSLKGLKVKDLIEEGRR